MPLFPHVRCREGEREREGGREGGRGRDSMARSCAHCVLSFLHTGYNQVGEGEEGVSEKPPKQPHNAYNRVHIVRSLWVPNVKTMGQDGEMEWVRVSPGTV